MIEKRLQVTYSENLSGMDNLGTCGGQEHTILTDSRTEVQVLALSISNCSVGNSANIFQLGFLI